jgi:hypothetical protein
MVLLFITLLANTDVERLDCLWYLDLRFKQEEVISGMDHTETNNVNVQSR